jgi:hypothetical protein
MILANTKAVVTAFPLFIVSYGATADWGTVTDEDTGRTVVFRRDPSGDGMRWYRAETRQANKEDER